MPATALATAVPWPAIVVVVAVAVAVCLWGLMRRGSVADRARRDTSGADGGDDDRVPPRPDPAG